MDILLTSTVVIVIEYVGMCVGSIIPISHMAKSV